MPEGEKRKVGTMLVLIVKKKIVPRCDVRQNIKSFEAAALKMEFTSKCTGNRNAEINTRIDKSKI